MSEGAPDAKVLNSALRLLKFRPRFSWELRNRLHEKGFQAQEISVLISYLSEHQLLDDRRLLKAQIESWALYRRLGATAISARLSKLSVPKEVYQPAIASYFQANSTQSEEAIMALARKRLATLADPQSASSRAKLYRYLAARGYGYGEIKEALSKLSD